MKLTNAVIAAMEKFKIQPCLYDLEWAEGVVPSIAGDISVKLRRLMKGEIERGIEIQAVVPEKTSSLIYVPIKPSQDNVITVNDQEIWADGEPLGRDRKISYVSKSGDFIVFEFQAGTYRIRTVDIDNWITISDNTLPKSRNTWDS